MLSKSLRLIRVLMLILLAGLAVQAAEPASVIRGSTPTTIAPHGKGNVYGADIVQHAGRFWMYFGGQGDDGHDRIHLATSIDQQRWDVEGVVFAPPGVNHVNDPSVVIVDGNFLMFYTRANQGVTDSIGLALSVDGRQWQDHGSVLMPRPDSSWDSLLVGRPSVLHDGQRFRLWFDGRADLPMGAPDKTAPKSATSQRYVGYAESVDGKRWDRRDEYVFAGDSGGVHVALVDGNYVMLIESRQGTKWAMSQDGISWTDLGLLVERDQETAPYGHVTPFLSMLGGKGVLYFGAASSSNWNENSIMSIPVVLPFPSSN